MNNDDDTFFQQFHKAPGRRLPTRYIKGLMDP